MLDARPASPATPTIGCRTQKPQRLVSKSASGRAVGRRTRQLVRPDRRSRRRKRAPRRRAGAAGADSMTGSRPSPVRRPRVRRSPARRCPSRGRARRRRWRAGPRAADGDGAKIAVDESTLSGAGRRDGRLGLRLVGAVERGSVAGHPSKVLRCSTVCRVRGAGIGSLDQREGLQIVGAGGRGSRPARRQSTQCCWMPRRSPGCCARAATPRAAAAGRRRVDLGAAAGRCTVRR